MAKTYDLITGNATPNKELIKFEVNGNIYIRGELVLTNKEFADKLLDAIKEWLGKV